ncbi:MAG: acyltransferase [Lachnospiraceae bacterium]|nr:acyltransferase [Lachnospiraceae bacterium]
MNNEVETMLFSKEKTKQVKGVAIILMIIHHYISNNPGLPVALSFYNRKYIIATACKVCVSTFMILSGYGIAKSRENDKDLSMINTR